MMSRRKGTQHFTLLCLPKVVEPRLRHLPSLLELVSALFTEGLAEDASPPVADVVRKGESVLSSGDQLDGEATFPGRLN